MTIPVGARVHVSDQYYTGVALVLEYDAAIPENWPASERLPYYCHLIDLCDHEMCLPYDGCTDGRCLRWYALTEERSVA